MKKIIDIEWPEAILLRKETKRAHLFDKPVDIGLNLLFYVGRDSEDIEKVMDTRIRKVDFLNVQIENNQLEMNLTLKKLDNLEKISLSKSLGFTGVTDLKNYLTQTYELPKELYVAYF